MEGNKIPSGGLIQNSLDPQTIPLVTPEEFQEIKEQTSELFLSAFAPLEKMSIYSTAEWGFALFNAHGCLLRLFGQEEFLKNCEDIGIRRGTVWTEEKMGDNAVSRCLEKMEPTVTLWNFHTVSGIREITFFASSISMDMDNIRSNFYAEQVVHRVSTRPDSAKNIGIFGAVAILSFQKGREDLFLPLVEAVTREINLQLRWLNYSDRDISNETGSICLEMSRGDNQITIITSNVLRYFRLPNNRGYRLHPLETIFEKNAKNKELWDIIEARSIVQNYEINLTAINGRSLNVSMFTHRSIEERLRMHEFVIHFQFNQRENELRAQYVSNPVHFTFENMICQSNLFRNVVDYARTAAATDANILILGESGVGKDVLAQAIHNASKRGKRPFVVTNCAAFSRELIASELFGYEPGAFTGAKKSGAIGKFEMANNGTIFLDEIGDMPLDMQAHLLRAIEQKRFMKVGGNTEIHSNARVIAATNADLENRMLQKLFRQDLFYRLSVITIRIPPLRERVEDILPMAEYFIQSIARRFGKPPFMISKNAEQILMEYSWPGNVRELQNLLESIIILNTGQVITEDHVLRILRQKNADHLPRYRKENMFALEHPQNSVPEETFSAIDTSKRQNRKLAIRPTKPEREEIIDALEKSNYSVSAAATLLGISRRTLYRRLEEYDLLK